MRRGFKVAYKLSNASGQMFRELALKNQIDNYQELESKRHMISIAPGYEALAAFGGSLIQIHRRARSTMNDRQAARYLWDTVNTLLRAIVDQGRLKNYEATEFVEALELTISRLAKPGFMFQPKLLVKPGQPARVVGYVIKKDVVQDTFGNLIYIYTVDYCK